ncbi:MAG: PQQ-binding-like beta-propeller repeat protein [Thermoplasmata archaeon]
MPIVNDRAKVVIAVVLALLVVIAVTVLVVSMPAGHSGMNPTAVVCSVGPSSTADTMVEGNWTTYHQSNSRAGGETTPTPKTVNASWSSPTALDGQVYAEPLVCGGAVFVATENDSVYAINA